MNQLLSVFILSCFSLLLGAQHTEGVIYYKETVQLDVQFPEGQEHLKDMVPASQSRGKALFFTAEKSLYKDLDPADNETEINHEEEGGNMQIKMVIASPDNRMYKDFSTGKVVDQRDFMGRKFLIDDQIKEYAWKITGEQKELLGYTCQKAILQDTAQNLVAWFTPQIPLPNGPDAYGQLPGMILETNIDDGKRTVVASKIDLNKPEKAAIEVPKKGKKVTAEEFEKIRAKKLKEMGAEGGRGAVIRMDVRNN